MSNILGNQAEERARLYLIAQGLQWLSSNYRSRLGEIDLVMQDSEYIVFIEVRHRASSAFGGALASITPAKMQKIKKTAAIFLQTKKCYDTIPCRFDVISFDGIPPQITWIKNAFGADF
jgi:putative endonuclease